GLAVGVEVFGVRLWNEHVRESREEAIHRIRVAEGKVKRDRGLPDLPAIAVDLKDARGLTESILADVASLPTVRELNLSLTWLEDKHLRYFENMASLEVLWLPPSMTDASFDHIQHLHGQHTFGLNQTA